MRSLHVAALRLGCARQWPDGRFMRLLKILLCLSRLSLLLGHWQGRGNGT